MSSEQRRVYMREYMRIQRAKQKTGRTESVGVGVVASVGGVKKQSTARPVLHKEAPLEGDYVAGRKRHRRSGGSGSRTVEVEFPDGVRTVRDARFRVPNRRNVTPRPIDPLSGIKPKNERCRSRSERLHLSYSPPVFYTKGGTDEPVSLCGGIWAPGRVVENAPPSQICRRCLAGRDRAQKRAEQGARGQERREARFKAYQEAYGVKKISEVALIDGKRAEAALEEHVPDPRGGHNRGKVRITLVPGGIKQWARLTTVIPAFAPAWCQSEVEVRHIGLSSGSETLLLGEAGSPIHTEYAFPVPPPMVEYDGHQYWRKSLKVDGKRPLRYYRAETPDEAALKVEANKTRARLLELWVSSRDGSGCADSLTKFIDAHGLGGQRVGHLGLGTSEDPIHFIEHRHRGGRSTFDYVAQYGSNRFAVLLTDAVWVGDAP